MKINESLAKSIITATKVPSADYTINPYTGCQFACVYCYATFMGRYQGYNPSEWGEWVNVKTNAVELARKGIKKLLRQPEHPRVVMSTVTDPYQGVERKYRLSRGILETFAENNYRGRFNVLTKSPIVLDDASILQGMLNAEVGLSITTTDDVVSRRMDAMAPLASARLKTLEELNRLGIKTYVFIGPLMPHLAERPELIDNLLRAIRDAGTLDVKVEHLNMKTPSKESVLALMEENPTPTGPGAKQKLEEIVKEAMDRYGFNMRFGQVVDHKTADKLVETC